MTRLTLIIPAVALATLVLACGDGDADDTDTTAPATEAPGASFDPAGEWIMVGGTLDDEPIPLAADRPITLQIEADGSVGGQSACNSYMGRLVRPSDLFELGNVVTTLMACEEEVMESEAAYLAALERIVGGERTGDRLLLTGPGAELEFSATIAES